MGSEFSRVLLPDVLAFANDKVSVNTLSIEDYISTENLLPDFGGVVVASSLPTSGKVTKFEKNDILFSNIRTYFKKLWFADRGGACSNDVIVFRAAKGVFPRYAFYSLMNEEFIEYTVQTSKGTKMPRGDKNAMAKYSMLLPELKSQKAIAHILGSLDDKIELNRKMNQTLEAMAQALFKSWFVDFDPVIDNALREGNPIPDELEERATVRQSLGDKRKPLPDDIQKLFPSEFEETEEMGWIPKGWKIKPVSQAIVINPSAKLSKGAIAPFADMKALPTNGYSINGVIEKEYSGGAKFQNGDVLLARITPCLENGKTGIVDFLSTPTDMGFGSTEFIVLRGNDDISLPYVACLAREESFRLHCVQSMVGSSGRQRVQNACFDSFFVALPYVNGVLRKFADITEPMFKKTFAQAKECNTLTELRDTLLPKLISGELRIEDAEKLTKEAIE